MADGADISGQPGWLARNDGRIGGLAFLIAAVGGIVVMLAGAGYQRGLWSIPTAFTLLRSGAYIAAAGASLCVIAVIVSAIAHKAQFWSRGAMAIIGIFIGAIAFYTPYSFSKVGAPPIHDITTDIDNPPMFVDALAVREAAKAANTADYVRDWKFRDRTLDVPALQRTAFPDIQPVKLAQVAPADAFNRALDAVKAQKWTIIAANANEGRIEAWDKTPWFGFVDDVVIRITPEDGGSRVDIRSVSRVGIGDVGKNAQRIRAYVATLTGAKG